MAKKKELYRASPRDMLALEFPVDVRISPDGERIAFTVRSTNWKDNRYESHCHIHDVTTNTTRRITRSGSVQQMEWVDDETLAMLKTNGGKAQVWFFEGGVGEGWQVTDHKTGIEWFHPFAGGVVFKARQPDKDEKKTRTDQYGRFTHFEQEDSASAVYYVGIQELLEYQRRLRSATEDEGKKLISPVIELSKLFTKPIAIKDLVPAPTGDILYLNCWQRDDLVYLRETRVFQIKLDAKSALAKYLELEKAKQVENDASSKEEMMLHLKRQKRNRINPGRKRRKRFPILVNYLS